MKTFNYIVRIDVDYDVTSDSVQDWIEKQLEMPPKGCKMPDVELDLPDDPDDDVT